MPRHGLTGHSPRMGRRRLLAVACALIPFLIWHSAAALADPVSARQAHKAVAHWLRTQARPLGAGLGREVRSVEAFKDDGGTALYYVVYLEPDGFAIVAADDLVEPIVAFAASGKFVASDTDPLGALVVHDLPGRVRKAQSVARAPRPTGPPLVARAKWRRLATDGPLTVPSVGGVSGERVAPLVQSRWAQGSVGGSACYNTYTPNHYVCGCVATAMAQLMRFWRHPTTGVGTGSFTVYVDGSAQTARLRGGDGSGGPYAWGQMPLVPNAGTPLPQRQAIGALCYDAGVAVNMDYSASGSGAYLSTAAAELVSTFRYANAVFGWNRNYQLGANMTAMVNPNLDAGMPVLLGIFGSGGHAIVCDGYGYDQGTMYHHLNLGWGGAADAWYNLPDVDTGTYAFDSVEQVVYNIYKAGSGEIISGRVSDTTGGPIAGATVTATASGRSYTATANTNGIYAIVQVPSATQFTVAAASPGYTFTTQATTTGTSTDRSARAGNVWGVDFVGTTGADACILTVRSSPISGVAIAGTRGGATPYTGVFEEGQQIALTAPEWAASDGTTYAFARWTINGAAQADGNATLSYSVAPGATVVAVYERAPDLAVTTTSLPSGTRGAAYAATLEAIGGLPPRQWSVMPDEALAASHTPTGGIARSWRADDASWRLVLPFAFPFAGSSYRSVYVCSNGYLDLTSAAADYTNSATELAASVRIAPLWDDLKTSGTAQAGEDIYVHQPDAHSVAIRWVAETYWGAHPVSFEVVLRDTGDIEFRYGTGNTRLSPTVGISAGDGIRTVLSAHNGHATMTRAQTAVFRPLHPGLGLDTVAGRVVGTPQVADARPLRFFVHDATGASAARDLVLAVGEDMRRLTVRSKPFDGVPIAGNPAGVTPYEADCPIGQAAALTAPAEHGELAFQRWEDSEGNPIGTDAALGLGLDTDATVVAVYAAADQPTDTPPAVQNLRFTSVLAPEGGMASVAADIADDGGVAQAWCELSIDGGAPVNYPMTRSAGGPAAGTWATARFAYPANTGSASVAFAATVHAADTADQVASAQALAFQDPVPPAINVTPATALWLGSVGVGTAVETDAYTVTNTGGGTLTGTVSLAAPFAIVGGGAFALAAGESQVVRVRFAPSGGGTHTASLAFASNAGTVWRPVSGEGLTTPVLEVLSADDLDFGEVYVGDVGEIDDAYIFRNAGGGTLVVNISVPSPFHGCVGDDWPRKRVGFTLGAGEERALSVDFAPLRAGRATVTISISTNAGRTTRRATGVGVLPTVSIAATDSEASEAGLDPARFTVSRTGTTGTAMAIRYTERGTAKSGRDYGRLPRTLTIPAGQRSATIDLVPIDDDRAEPTETVTVTLRTGRLFTLDPAHASAEATLADDEPVVSLVATDPTASEAGGDTGQFTLTRTGSTASPLTVRCTARGSASKGRDYQRLPTRVVIPAGAASVAIDVVPIDDAYAESPETVELSVRSDREYWADAAHARATVTLDDDEPVVSVAATDPAASEAGGDTGQFTLTRTGSTAAALTVRCVARGTASGNRDYQRLPTRVTIPAGAASVAIDVVPIDDDRAEATETVTLMVRADRAYSAAPARDQATVTIADDETTVARAR